MIIKILFLVHKYIAVLPSAPIPSIPLVDDKYELHRSNGLSNRMKLRLQGMGSYAAYAIAACLRNRRRHSILRPAVKVKCTMKRITPSSKLAMFSPDGEYTGMQCWIVFKRKYEGRVPGTFQFVVATIDGVIWQLRSPSTPSLLLWLSLPSIFFLLA
jgi:hypothetical protein